MNNATVLLSSNAIEPFAFFFIERNLLYATQATFRLYNIKINLYIIVHSIFITEFYLLMHGMNDMEETLVVYALCSQYAIYSDR